MQLASTAAAERCPPAARLRSAPVRPPPAHSRPVLRRTRTPCRCRSMHTLTRTSRMHTTTNPHTTRRDYAPRRRTSLHTVALALMVVDHPSRRASVAAARARVRSTSAPTASCSRTTPATSRPSSTSTSPELCRSTSPKRACRWRRETCPRRFSTRRRRVPPAPDSTSTIMTPGTSTMRGTVTRRTDTRPSTTRRRRTTTWRRRATAGCFWAAARCTRSTSRWTGRRTRTHTRTPRTLTTRTRTTPRRTSTPLPARRTPTRRRPVWRRRCRTRRRTCTGSEAMAPPVPTAEAVVRDIVLAVGIFTWVPLLPSVHAVSVATGSATISVTGSATDFVRTVRYRNDFVRIQKTISHVCRPAGARTREAIVSD